MCISCVQEIECDKSKRAQYPWQLETGFRSGRTVESNGYQQFMRGTVTASLIQQTCASWLYLNLVCRRRATWSGHSDAHLRNIPRTILLPSLKAKMGPVNPLVPPLFFLKKIISLLWDEYISRKEFAVIRLLCFKTDYREQSCGRHQWGMPQHENLRFAC